jgi:hypothetical protein
MRQFLIVLIAAFLLACTQKEHVQNSYDQTDSTLFEIVPMPHPEYVVYRFDSVLLDSIPSYNYSNRWDLDGDNKKDSLIFVGNGGAHLFFHLQVKLSSDHKLKDFPSIEIDMPYISSIDVLKKTGANPGLQFIVHDFDNDGIPEVYLNMHAPHNQIPTELKDLGITSSQILVDCSERNIEIKNFQF